MSLKNKIMFAFAMLILPQVGGAAVTHIGKEVSVFQSADSRPCAFFTLTGVSEADPIVANNPWFSVPQTHVGYKEIVSALLAARTSGKTITVVTTGDNACGHAAVNYVQY